MECVRSAGVGGCNKDIEQNIISPARRKKGVDLCEPMWKVVKVPIKRLEPVMVQARGLGAVTGQGWDGDQGGGVVGANNESVLLS